MPGHEIQKWADKAMFEAEEMPKDAQGVRPKAYLLSATPDPLGAIAAMCCIYEGKVVRDLADVTDEQRRHYWEQVKKTHLKAPLEAVDLHFMVEGVTRSFTHQMVRQRTAVFAQESLRFAVKENMADEVPLPPSLLQSFEEMAAADAAGEPATQKELAQDVWRHAVSDAEEAYNVLINMGVPAEDARGLLPHSVTTRLHYKTNLRNLLDHAGNRLCTQAQFEWRYALAEMVKAIREHVPADHWDGARGEHRNHSWQFNLIADDGLFKPVCYALGHCPFTATFDRDCTIRERVQRGAFDEINDREWLVDPAAARRG